MRHDIELQQVGDTAVPLGNLFNVSNPNYEGRFSRMPHGILPMHIRATHNAIAKVWMTITIPSTHSIIQVNTHMYITYTNADILT